MSFSTEILSSMSVVEYEKWLEDEREWLHRDSHKLNADKGVEWSQFSKEAVK